MLAFTIYGTDKEMWINPLNVHCVQIADTSERPRTLLICGDTEESMYYAEGTASNAAMRIETVLNRWRRR